MGQTQYRVTQNHHQLLILATETTSQWLIANFSNNPLSDPLPELRLGGPELFLIRADYQGVILFSFLLVVSGFQHGRINRARAATFLRHGSSRLSDQLIQIRARRFSQFNYSWPGCLPE
jgi:hypothetical protein